MIRVLYRFQAHTEDDMKELTDKRQCISSELRFYTISDMQELLGWSEKTVKKLFNDPACKWENKNVQKRENKNVQF